MEGLPDVFAAWLREAWRRSWPYALILIVMLLIWLVRR